MCYRFLLQILSQAVFSGNSAISRWFNQQVKIFSKDKRPLLLQYSSLNKPKIFNKAEKNDHYHYSYLANVSLAQCFPW